MKPNPLVSVIIPCFNVSAFVEKAIYSIINQSYQNLEILIIDDGSTDDTLMKLKLIKDQRIRLFVFKENTKKVGAVNSILKETKGDLVAFQDADDWSELIRIEEQIKQFHMQPDLGVCFTRNKYIDRTNFIPDKISITNEELRLEFLSFKKMRENDFFPTICGTMMISREALTKTGGYHPYFAGRVGEDIHWIYRILKEFKGITVNKVLYNYKIREGSFTEILSSGKNAKYAYSWHLLEKIIHMDFSKNIDVLVTANVGVLKQLELMACEEALTESIKSMQVLKRDYENSASLRLGRALLWPMRILKKNFE